MDSSDYDCPQYVDFTSENFWNQRASPIFCQADKSKHNDALQYESLRTTTQAEDANIQISSEGCKAMDTSFSSNDALAYGSLNTTKPEEDCIIDPSESYEAMNSPFSSFSNDSLIYGHLSTTHAEDANIQGSTGGCKAMDTPFSSVSSKSSTFAMTDCESPQDFPLHRANLNDFSELKKMPKRVISNKAELYSQVENRNYSAKFGLKQTEHESEKGSLDLQNTKKRKIDTYLSLAEQVAAFQNKTPERFHTTKKGFETAEYWSPTRVVPKSPNLQAAKRRRMVKVLSQEEKEKKEIEEMQKHQFHAKPLDPKIFDEPELPKVHPKPGTKPKSINFKTAQRAAEHYAKKKQDVQKYEFHARPVPEFVTGGSKELKKNKRGKSPTKPVSPNFSLKNREEKWRAYASKSQEIPKKATFKAHPPSNIVPFTVKHEKMTTEVQPFSFDAKDKERFALKKQKIEEEIQKENMIPPFKAQPVPNHQTFDLSQVSKKPLKEPEQFSFSEVQSNRSGKHSTFNSSNEEHLFKFTAQPATVLHKKPFVPKKAEKAFTEINEFNLYTDIRASERQHQKELKQIEEEEKENALLLLRKAEEEQERREILKLRRELVHKANPIRHYKSIEIQPSSKSLTQPLSPKFATDERFLPKS